MSEPILVVCPDLSAEEEDRLTSDLGSGLAFTVVANEERDLQVTATLDPELAKLVWDAFRFVVDVGAATTGTIELVRWVRRTRGATAPIDVVKDAAIYRLPPDTTNDRQLARIRAMMGEPYDYDQELHAALAAIDQHTPATRSTVAYSALATGMAKHTWDSTPQRWTLSQRYIDPDLAALRAEARDGAPESAFALAKRLFEYGGRDDEAIDWLRKAHNEDNAALIADLAGRNRSFGAIGTVHDARRAAAMLADAASDTQPDSAARARLALTRVLAHLGHREHALDALAPLISTQFVDEPGAAPYTERVLQQARREAMLERARLLAATDDPAAEYAYQRCVDAWDAGVAGRATVELSDLLAAQDRAAEARAVLDAGIARSGAVACEIGKALEAAGRETAALEAYVAAGERNGEAALRRGLLLEAAGKRADARLAYRVATASLNMVIVKSAVERLQSLDARA